MWSSRCRTRSGDSGSHRFSIGTSGRYRATGASRSTRPSVTSRSTPVATRVFATEPTCTRSPGDIGRWREASFRPAAPIVVPVGSHERPRRPDEILLDEDRLDRRRQRVARILRARRAGDQRDGERSAECGREPGCNGPAQVIHGWVMPGPGPAVSPDHRPSVRARAAAPDIERAPHDECASKYAHHCPSRQVRAFQKKADAEASASGGESGRTRNRPPSTDSVSCTRARRARRCRGLRVPAPR